MAIVKTEHYVCDRCRVKIDKPFSGGESGTYKVTFSADYAVAGNTVSWKELCVNCNHYLSDLMNKENTKADNLRKTNGS